LHNIWDQFPVRALLGIKIAANVAYYFDCGCVSFVYSECIEDLLTYSTDNERNEKPRPVSDHLENVDQSSQPKQHDEDDRRNCRWAVVVEKVGGVVGHGFSSLT
jgi:hypothetical protein